MAGIVATGSVVLGFVAASVEPTAASTFLLSASATATISILVLRSEYRRSDLFSPLGLIAVCSLARLRRGRDLLLARRACLGQNRSAFPPISDREALSQASLVGLISLCAVVLGYRLNPFRVVTRDLPGAPKRKRP